MPPENCSSKRAYKFPLVASEVLSCNVTLMHDKLLKDDFTLTKLFSIFEGPGTNDILFGYFCKLSAMLINRNPRRFLSFVFDNQYNVKLLSHIHVRSISELILKFFQIDENSEDLFLSERINLASEIFKKIKDGETFVAANTSMILSKFLSENTTFNCWNQIASFIVQEENLDLLFSLISENKNIVHCAAIIKSLLILPNRNALIDLSKDYEGNSSIIKTLIKVLPKFLYILNASGLQINTSFRKETEILGQSKLAVLEIISLAICMQNDYVNEEVVKSGLIELFVRLFFKFDYNSCLQLVFYDLVQTIIAMNIETAKHLINHSGLIKGIIADGTKAAKHPIGQRKGNIGYIIKIGNLLHQSSQQIRDLIESQPDWYKFIYEFLLPEIEIQTIPLGSRKLQDINASELMGEEKFEKALKMLKISNLRSANTSKQIVERSLLTRNKLLSLDTEISNGKGKYQDTQNPNDPAEDYLRMMMGTDYKIDEKKIDKISVTIENPPESHIDVEAENLSISQSKPENIDAIDYSSLSFWKIPSQHNIIEDIE